MKDNFPKIFLLAVIGILILPQVSFAAWWNPFTWKIFSKTPAAKVQEAKQPSEIEKLRSEVEELKKIQSETSTSQSSINTISSKQAQTKIQEQIPVPIVSASPNINEPLSGNATFNQTEWDNSVKQLSQIAENLRKSVDIKPPQQTTQTPNTLPVPVPVVNTPPPNTTFCNGTNWSHCPTGQDFVCPSSGSAYCQLPQQQVDLLVEQQRQQQLAEQQLQLYVQLQAEQEKQRQVNLQAQDLYSEYQNKIAAIDQQILDVKTAYHKSKADIESMPISSQTIVGHTNNLINQTNRKIETLVNQKEQLRLDYLNRINNLR